MVALSLACAGHVDLDGGDTRPRHISTQGIQPQGMDVVASLARLVRLGCRPALECFQGILQTKRGKDCDEEGQANSHGGARQFRHSG